MSCTLSVVDGVPLLESRLGKLLKFMKTVALSLLLRCPNYSTGPLAPCWSLAPIQYKCISERGGGLSADRLGFAAKQSPGAKQ